MNIKILGTGCAKCEKLEKNTNEVIKELGMEATIEKIEDIQEIIKYGVMKTPALVINEKVKASGKVLKPKEIKKFFM